MAQVRLTPPAAKVLEALNNPIHGRMLKLLERLGDWPNVSGAKPLRHGLKGRYRVRTGDYRLQFHVQGDIVYVEKIGHRDDFYED